MLIVCRCGCGQEFEPCPRQQRFFSEACRQKRNREKLAEYRIARGKTAAPKIRTEPSHTAGGVGDDPRTDVREARIAGHAGFYEANALALMRRTGLTRAAAMSLPCVKADEILKGIEQ